MCESYDVLKSTYQSAPTMTYTFCDYGGGSMGYGIRKFADEMIDTGIKEGVRKGILVGFCEGYKKGFSEGRAVGFVEGSLITTVVLSALGLSVWGVNKIRNKNKINNRKKLSLENEINEKEEICNAEVQSNF